jgi:Bacterial extracellular solute-binding protein
VSQELDVKAVVAKIQLGEADAGIVYATDVTPSLRDTVKVLAIPDRFNVIAQYPIGVVRDAANPAAAEPHLCGSGETWFFVSNGPGTGNWQQVMAPGPSPRVLAGMADLPPPASPGPLPVGNFSPVLFGGWLNRDPATGLGNHGRSAETWLPNSAGPGPNFWTLSAPSNGVTIRGTGIGPPARCVVVFATTMVLRPGILLFSGHAEGDENEANTWLYQPGGGGSWTQIQDRSGPGTVSRSLNCDDAASAQDPTTGTPVLFNDSGQTWRWGP